MLLILKLNRFNHQWTCLGDSWTSDWMSGKSKDPNVVANTIVWLCLDEASFLLRTRIRLTVDI